MSKLRVMITGCAGFIGSHVTEEFLNAGYDVVGVDSFTYAGKKENLGVALKHPNFQLIECDITRKSALYHFSMVQPKNKFDWIIHLAAETHVDNSIESSDIFMETNIMGTKSILDLCREQNIKLFHFSTDEVYGCATHESFKEDRKFNPKNPYSASKAAAEHLITSYANTYGVEYIVVRPSNNYGTRQDSEKFLPTVIRKLQAGEKVPVYGNGEQEREWTHVKETAKATRFILENSKINETYNISSRFHLKNIEVVKEVCNILGKDFGECVDYVDDRPGHDFKYSIDPSKLNCLGYNVSSDFTNSILEIIVK
jgi:dTDP-glucose 4,6-dehydratase|tara:strand:- start:6776 stop:7711 length:936 start_codon:yes stop_codon:yes gene_type:complete